MASLFETLPDLVHSITAALVQIGRGDVADQLREVELERWTYDEFADVGYLHLRSPRKLNVADERIGGVEFGETVSPFDDLNLHLDNHRRLTGIELFNAKAIISQLEGTK